MSARRLLQLSVIRLSIENGSELGNVIRVSQMHQTCNKEIRGDMGLEMLKSCRDRVKMVPQASNIA